MTAITIGALLTELMRSFDGFIAIRKYVKVSSSETLQSESAFITASRYDRGQYMILLYLSCVLEADFVSLFTASKSLQTDPRIPYPDSRFIVRETGFSESWFGSALLLTAVPVALGMALTAKSPDLVKRIAPGISRAAVVLFALIIIAALAKNWEVFSSNLGTLGPVAVVLNVLMLCAGIATAKVIGLNRSDATTISLESGVQNGTLAIAVGSIIAGSVGETLPSETVPAAVYSITMYLVCVPFVLWRRRN